MNAPEAARIAIGALVHRAAQRPDVAATPYEVVHRQDKLELRFYGDRRGTPVVLVPSLINRSSILDLEPGRSLVAWLAQRGHAVYLVDWGTPGAEDAGEDVAYVVLELLHRSIDRAARHAGRERVTVLGYCLGGTLAVVLAALRPARFAGLCALNAPVAFSRAGRFRDLVAPAALDLDRLAGPDGLVPVEAMKAAFPLLDPVGAVTKFLAVEEAASDPDRLRRVMARERWLEENVPVSGAFAREFIQRAYRDDALVAGSWHLGGEPIRLADIRCPTRVVACARDFICPPAAATALADHVAGAQVEVVDCGHIGVMVGREGPGRFYPLLADFAAACS
jgi:polyhydroxyalkanoate synthase